MKNNKNVCAKTCAASRIHLQRQEHYIRDTE